MNSRTGLVGLLIIWSGAASAAELPITPGQWETTSAVESVEMPGAPQEMLNMMKRKPTVITNCITKEQAENGPRELMKQTNGACEFTEYTFDGGTMKSVMTCSQQGGQMTVSTTGSYTNTSYTARSEIMMLNMPGMKMTATATGKRIGDCE